ncbi:MAG: transposase [Desulfobacteraceae bacterium]|jgi:IS605 OrfB family transposase
MNLTLKIKILPNTEQKQRLKDLFTTFNSACNDVSEVAYRLKTASQVKLHRECYYGLREKYGLKAQLAVRAIGKVVENYRRDKTKKHVFKPMGAVVLDNKLMSYKGVDRISITSLTDRMVIPIVIGAYGTQHFRRAKGQADLVFKNGSFYILQNCVYPDDDPIDPKDFLGVDLGVVNVAVDSDGEVFSGSVVKSVRHRHRRLRKRLQAKGTKSAKRRLKKLSGKERRFSIDVNHCISKHIVQKAQRTGRGIAVEDLKHIRKRVTARRSGRAILHNWAFAQLRSFIEYKAKIAQVLVIPVDPRNTSRTCPICGCIDKRNRKTQSSFSCVSCGHSGMADKIAALNIRSRASANTPNVEAA